jgi:NADPH:quinone reductase
VGEITLALVSHWPQKYVPELVPLMRVFGQIGHILPGGGPPQAPDDSLTWTVFKRSLSFHYEWMFAKSMWGRRLESQGAILDRVGELAGEGAIDAGVTRSDVLSVATLREAHELQESGRAFGKTALEVPETIVQMGF